MKKILSFILVFCLTACLAAICPVAVSAEEYIPELADTEIYSYFNVANFKNCIDVDGYIYDYAENYFFAAQLYDAENCLIEEKKSACDDYMIKLSFLGLSNEADSYMVRYWLEDEAGNVISPVGTEICETRQAPECFYGLVAGVGTETEGFATYFQIKMLDTTGAETIYDCADSVTVNGNVYRDAEALQEVIPCPSIVKFVCRESEIASINIISVAAPTETIGLCGENFIWRLTDEGMLTVTGEKALAEYSPFIFCVAGYGTEGEMLHAKKITPTEKNGVLYAETELDTEQIVQADSVRIFIWESLASMKPLYTSAFIIS